MSTTLWDMKTMGNNTTWVSFGIPVRLSSIMSALRFRGDIVLIENEDVSVIITLIIILTLSF